MFDNVEDPALPQAWLPTTGGGHALITSRRTDWGGRARAFSLELMALRLLAGGADPDALSETELAAAKALADELGYLPLALAQARAYIVATGRSIAGYLRLFRDGRPADFAGDRPGPDYPASYVTTWRISADAAAAACPAVRPLLELLAFFAAEPLPREVPGADPSALPDSLQRERERDDAIAALRRYSLIGAEGGRLTIHQLVQAVTRDGLDEATRHAKAETAVRLVAKTLPQPPWEHYNWPRIGALVPHVLMTTEAAERLEVSLDAVASVLNRMALYYQSRTA